VLSAWFRQPHPRFGTSYRVINIVVALQILTIIISRGNVTFLANLYAFGVIWSFAMNGLAVLVLRYTSPGQREFQVPLNFTFRGVQIPVGLGLITLMLFLIAIVNLFTKPVATMAGGAFSVLLYIVFTISERRGRRGGAAHVEMDQFNLELESELTPEAVGARRATSWSPSATTTRSIISETCWTALSPGAAMLSCSTSGSCAARLRAKTNSRPISFLAASSNNSSHKRFPWPKNAANRSASPSSPQNDLWDGILRAATSLQSSTIVVGRSTKESNEEQARQIGEAWEKLGDQKPQFNLEIHLPNGDKLYKVLGPHAPNLTANEVNLLHRLWLRFSDAVAPLEMHHHDVVHFALEEVKKEMRKDTKTSWSIVCARISKPTRRRRLRRPEASRCSGLSLFLNVERASFLPAILHVKDQSLTKNH